MSLINIILQALIALIVIFFVYSLARWAMNKDINTLGAKYDEQTKNKVAITNGQIDNTRGCRRYNTRFTYAGTGNYLPIKPSINRRGGAQFTYSFWLFLESPDQLMAFLKERLDQITDIVPGAVDRRQMDRYCLFLHGDRVPHLYDEARAKVTQEVTSTTGFEKRLGRIAACPGVYINRALDIEIEFNTTTRLKHTSVIKSTETLDSTKRHNITSVQTQRWVLYTIVLADNMPVSDFEDGIQVRTYVNETLYQVDKFPRATLIPNAGLFSMLADEPTRQEGTFPKFFTGTNKLATPNGKVLRLSDVTYYNYALSDADIARKYKRGPSLHMHVDDTKNNDVFNAAAYNKLDIYNL